MEGKHTPARKGGRRRLEKRSEAHFNRTTKQQGKGLLNQSHHQHWLLRGSLTARRRGFLVFSSLTVRQNAHLALARMRVRWDRQAQCYSVSLSLANGSEVTNTLKGEGRADITCKEVLLYTQMRGFLGKASIFEFVLFQTTVNLRDCVWFAH